ncbi:MAG: bifunctional precorrin-2 dehydrogenase/sirohydrochlorin ferrochelatase [Proteobacteria bacterium]|nr:bifunctional precorrin-2 dehydrogenase/sirohydrochlorin ferrochelatase [Pseudomonadota bacterium]MBU1714181.1 bifunctional precorrin-2 dehydrogenase/sirohydrochlorin ferrochelatase [Pseudomonadota bacterium]
MEYFPVNLKISGRHCVVIGGGRVAERKAKALLSCGGLITVISPELTSELAALHRAGSLRWIDRHYRSGDLRQAFLVIAATDDPEAQRIIAAEADEYNILLNVADVPKWCNFILPATVSRGDLTVSVSTGGKSPALARKLRRQLELQFGPEYEVLLIILGEVRTKVLKSERSQSDNKQIFEALLHEDFLVWVCNHDWERIDRHLHDILKDDFDQESMACLRDQFEGALSKREC